MIDGPKFTVERIEPNSFTIGMEGGSSDWEQWILLTSDRHHDHAKCDQDLELHHLNQAVHRHAIVVDNGDLFCAMQGKYDRRSNLDDLREEYRNGRYLDSLVSVAADFYSPYARNIAVLGKGNHETSILKHHETDLTDRLASELRQAGGHTLAGGYANWVRFRVSRTSTETHSLIMWMMHGYGGGGPVTKDMIQRARQHAYIEGADIILTGHTHDSWATEDVKVYLGHTGKVKQRRVLSLKCPTYKDEYGTGSMGWHVETGKPPKPKGAWWLRLFHGKDKTLRYEYTAADQAV